MSRTIGFHVYSFRVRQKRSLIYENLSAVQQKDLLSELQTSMHAACDAQNNNAAMERVACLKRVDVSGRHMTGLIEAGPYGTTANIVNSVTGKMVHQQDA